MLTRKSFVASCSQIPGNYNFWDVTNDLLYLKDSWECTAETSKNQHPRFFTHCKFFVIGFFFPPSSNMLQLFFHYLLFSFAKTFPKFSGFLNLENSCYSSFSFPSPFAKKNSPRTNRLNSFCVSLLSFPKELRTNRLNSFCVSLLPFSKEQRTNCLNSFVSPFSLVKEFKTTQSENSFDSSHSLIQKCSKD